MFLGNYEHSIDSKGRLAVPVRFREELGQTFYVTRWLDKCLTLYSPPEFERIAAQISNLSMADPTTRNLRRIFFSEASQVEVDKQGRINIPARLRQFADMGEAEAQVIVVGQNTYIEIWAADLWEKVQNDVEENVGSIADQLAKMGVI